ncbi:hydroxyisourate hydrolase [Microbacterium capsulatum]|uniref:5-hydroxyisourate hydrolase n=1 Tax=Microbacterium capsulatum TaxID=3041921 RepID=A0ABU0XFS5_9MICO|nr:hydroxyisourate hydrolase [Microbacterium sp. ASV81]MDQ4213969.1 hydroxyisourate hydrolase [Microbacterium sp. ASV81]
MAGAASAPAPKVVPAAAVAATADRSQISTHILDTGKGKPAGGVPVTLEAKKGNDDGNGWQKVADGVTNSDGRIDDLGPKTLDPGVYRLTFQTGDYFAKQKIDTFYPSITIEFTLPDNTQHYHVPLLLSPFAYSTYRGS